MLKIIKPITLATLISFSSLSQITMASSPFDGAENPDLSCISLMVKEMRIVQSLNLTVIQKQSLLNIRTIIKEHRQQIYQENNMQQQIVDLLTQPVLDQEKALELVKKRTAQVDDFAPTAIAAIAKFTDSLTEEQRALLKDRINELQQNCDNSLSSFIKELRTKVSDKLNILIPALNIGNNEEDEYWADLEYSGKDEEGKPSWTLKEFGKN